MTESTKPTFTFTIEFNEAGKPVTRAVWAGGEAMTPEHTAGIIRCLEHEAHSILDGVEMSEDLAIALASHRHYKGGLYRVIGMIRDADNGEAESRMLYQHLWPHDISYWHRNMGEFLGYLEDGRQRFVPFEDEIPFILKPFNREHEAEVVLRRLDTVGPNNMLVTEENAKALIEAMRPRLSRGTLRGEYGQPSRDVGHSMERFTSVDESNTCCVFTDLDIKYLALAGGRRQPVLTAKLKPSGPRAEDLVTTFNTQNVGFAMRAICEVPQVGPNAGKLIPKEVISFDFVAESALNATRAVTPPIKVRQHVPGFVLGTEPQEAMVATVKDALELDFVKSWKDKPKPDPFHQYSISKHHGNKWTLMAEYDEGRNWFVIAYLEFDDLTFNPLTALPQWEPNRTPK
jgi:hypothetical protein